MPGETERTEEEERDKTNRATLNGSAAGAGSLAKL